MNELQSSPKRPKRKPVKEMRAHACKLLAEPTNCGYNYLEYGEASEDVCMKLIHEAALYKIDLIASKKKIQKANEWAQWLFDLISTNDHETISRLAKLLKHRAEGKDFREFKIQNHKRSGRPSEHPRSFVTVAPIAFAKLLINNARCESSVCSLITRDDLKLALNEQLELPPESLISSRTLDKLIQLNEMKPFMEPTKPGRRKGS